MLRCGCPCWARGVWISMASKYPGRSGGGIDNLVSSGLCMVLYVGGVAGVWVGWVGFSMLRAGLMVHVWCFVYAGCF